MAGRSTSSASPTTSITTTIMIITMALITTMVTIIPTVMATTMTTITSTATIPTTSMATSTENLARLLQLASPALPVGAYSYSGGLEAAVEAGIVKDAESAERWIGDVLEHSVARM